MLKLLEGYSPAKSFFYASLTAVEKEVAGKDTMALMLFFVMMMAIVMMCASVK
jgi:hypothetical protein